MKNFRECCFPLLMMVVLLWQGCADPTFVGGDILEDDRIKSTFTDTVTIRSRTIRGDSVLTYSPNPIWLSAYLFGDFRDPVLGRTYTEIYAQPTLEISSVSFLRPNFDGALLDSVVLVLPYNGDGFYGDTDQPFSVEVHELLDSMSRDSVYYSSQTLSYGPVIGAKTFTPGLDSVTFIDYRRLGAPDTLSLSQLRVPLYPEFGQRLISADTSDYLTTANFRRFFPGFALRPTTETSGMIGFDMVPTGGPQDAGIYVYFRRDTIPTQYRFPISFGSPVSSYMENDYTGTVAESLIGSYDFSDSLSFLQGTEGLLVELDFPHLESLEDVIVNKAELLVPIVPQGDGDPELFPPARQVFAFHYDPEVAGNYSPIDDVLLPSRPTLDLVFGGLVEAGSNGSPDIYRMNISAWFQEMLKDDRETDVRDVIYLTVSPRSERVSRTAIYGAEHPQYPIKLNLTYTSQ